MLLHGQASIKRGFSENKDILSYNMGEHTLKAFRIPDIPVSKEWVKSCKQSRQMYSAFLKDHKKTKKNVKLKVIGKIAFWIEVMSEEGDKDRVRGISIVMTNKADNLCSETEKSQKWNLAIVADAFRA